MSTLHHNIVVQGFGVIMKPNFDVGTLVRIDLSFNTVSYEYPMLPSIGGYGVGKVESVSDKHPITGEQLDVFVYGIKSATDWYRYKGCKVPDHSTFIHYFPYQIQPSPQKN